MDDQDMAWATDGVPDVKFTKAADSETPGNLRTGPCLAFLKKPSPSSQISTQSGGDSLLSQDSSGLHGSSTNETAEAQVESGPGEALDHQVILTADGQLPGFSYDADDRMEAEDVSLSSQHSDSAIGNTVYSYVDEVSMTLASLSL